MMFRSSWWAWGSVWDNHAFQEQLPEASVPVYQAASEPLLQVPQCKPSALLESRHPPTMGELCRLAAGWAREGKSIRRYLKLSHQIAEIDIFPTVSIIFSLQNQKLDARNFDGTLTQMSVLSQLKKLEITSKKTSTNATLIHVSFSQI